LLLLRADKNFTGRIARTTQWVRYKYQYMSNYALDEYSGGTLLHYIHSLKYFGTIFKVSL
jgi:hypothetical protein